VYRPGIVGVRAVRSLVLHDFLQTPRLRPTTPAQATRALVVVAAPNEAKPILRGLGMGTGMGDVTLPEAWTLAAVRADVDLVITGISKSNAAGAVGRVLDRERHGLVLSLGIAGALPVVGSTQAFAAELGSIHVASSCVFADEGVETPESFVDCAAMGFPLADVASNAIPTDPALCALLASVGEAGPIATVSTCSGTDALAQRTAQRTLARVEGMEGAAVALVARRVGVPMIEVRVVSNTTGDRARQRWAIRPALERLGVVIERLLPLSR